MANDEQVDILASGIEAWNMWRRKNPATQPDLSNLDFTVDPRLWGLKRRQNYAKRGYGTEEVLVLAQIDFSNTNLHGAILSRIILTDSNFRNADLSYANLEGAWLSGINIIGAQFFRAILTDASVRRIQYRRSQLSGKFLGVRGAESMHGDAVFRRDVLDQEYLDTKRWHWRNPWWNPKRIFMLWSWAALDYGRSWFRVAVFAVFLIAIFGYGYAISNGTHIEFIHDGPTVKGPLYPWFIASMGFATLGISDLVEPLDGAGQVLIIGNVLSGFVTLGLLLSVLGNGFARRS